MESNLITKQPSELHWLLSAFLSCTMSDQKEITMQEKLERENFALRHELKSCVDANQEYAKRISEYQRNIEALQGALDQMTSDAVKAVDQRDRSIAISDGVMAWETMQDTRNSMKALAQLKQDIKDNA